MSSPDPPNVWSRVYNDVKMQIPGVTDAVLKQVIYQVWGDFTDMTNIWLEEVPIAVVPNTLSYTFSVAHKGSPNRLMLLYDPAVQGPDKKWVHSGVEMRIPGVIHLSYSPSTATTWNAVIAKSVNEVASDGYPAVEASDHWIVEQYGDWLHYGVMGRLQAMPGKPYTNAKMGASNWQTYVTGRGMARTDANKANVYGGQRWMFPQSFAVARRGGWT